MPTCPVCERTLPQELPPFCDRCGWEVKNDLTLVPTLGGIADAAVVEYRERITVARQVWNRQKELERNLEEMKNRLGEANLKGNDENKPSESSSKKAEEKSAKTEKKPRDRKQNHNYTPMIVAKEDARKVFGVGAWERLKKFDENDYRDNGDGTVTDRATGFTWQKSGSDRSINYEKAKQYVDKLNIERFAGYTDWRLPTVRELLTLMEPRKQGWRFSKKRLYINTIFDARQRCCWSANLCASGGAWYVSFYSGYVYAYFLDDAYYVRAVRSSTVDLVAGDNVLGDHKMLIERELYKSLVIKLGESQVSMRFVLIPPGDFMMGSPENEPGRFDDEKQHKVSLTGGFFMQETPVTQAQWNAVMGYNPSHFKECGPDCPVEKVSWDDSWMFLDKLNERGGEYEYRLPTEAQWEYACRAGTTTRYYTGDSETDLKRAGWYGENSGGKTHPVRQKKPNAFGLYDMHGNVWEWCADWFGDYPAGPLTDPTGYRSGAHRVFRGGSWSASARGCRSADRIHASPVSRRRNLGFRVIAVRRQK